MSAYQRILVAIDFSNSCDQVLNKGAALSTALDAQLHLLHVVEFLPPIDFGYEPIIVPDWYSNEEELVRQAEKRLTQLADEHAITSKQCIVLSGTPKTEITQYAMDIGADLIVIGSHGRHGIQRLLGSTAHPLLNHAPCDVLAVRISQ